ncbi:hypothetical protein LO772_01115 [Yinghuangia sp. ASG 101]|uniref:hypothetical protein n=1 Tax=Yinghuangia sp. ASG 101 TaxID=2896848 RepID=UPI001E341BAA|nr:hypothetical protein [Yinghuangia sp. ASG 101]UGQ12244.1 hypothetical protein LO772_01115 [Yinghuangia sp. ASG 101]
MTRRGMGVARVGQALGLVPRQVRLAARAGLLDQHEDGTFDADCVARAAADQRRFMDALHREEPLSTRQAAARLHVSRERFTRVARNAELPVVERQWLRRYGRDIEVCYYRTADVDALVPYIVADIELRAAAALVARSQAAAQAAVTRANNRERAKHARQLLATRRIDEVGDPVETVLWAVALGAAHGRLAPRLRRFRDDPRAQALADVVTQARLDAAELGRLAAESAGPALRALPLLARPNEVASRLGVPALRVAEHTPALHGYIARAKLDELAAMPPGWLLMLRGDQELERVAALWQREQERVWELERARAEAVMYEASRAVSRLSDESVAELFGLDEELVAGLRPRSGRWAIEKIEELLRTRPAWITDPAAARAEVARRERSAERRATARAARRLAWRRGWAKAFGVAVEDVPESVGRPTPAAVRAALAAPPHWAKAPGGGGAETSV